MNDFAHLHVHSDFSVLDGMCMIEKLFKKVKRLNMSAIAISDHGNIDCYVQALKKSKEIGVKYIPASEIYLVNDYENKTDKFMHLNVYARNKKGVSEIFKILGRANEMFYRKPIISVSDLVNRDCSNLVFSTACVFGPVLANNSHSIIAKLADATNTFVEVMPHYFKEQKQHSIEAIKIAKKFDLEIIGTNDAHYVDLKDANAHDVLLAINTGKKVSDNTRMRFVGGSYYICGESDFVKMFQKQDVLDKKQINKAISNTNIIVDLVDFDSFGKFDINIKIDGYDEKEFIEFIWRRFNKRFGDNLVYITRLKRELEMIMRKNFLSYFYIVYDFVKYARKQGIAVGPGRGSVGGSLLALILNITSVDPIKYNLSFERFIAEDRIDFPDIDLDFEDTRREEVIQYLKQKYGEANVVNISTFITLGNRATLQDVGRVCELDMTSVARASKAVDEIESDRKLTLQESCEKSDDLCKFFEEYPEHRDICMKVNGVIRSYGIHAAGCVIENSPINDSGRGYLARRKNEYVLNWDKDDAEYMGFLKFDLLGLNTLTIINRCLDLIEQRTGKRIKINKIDYENDEVLNVFRQGDTTGVFQFSSYGMKSLLKSAPIECFKDIYNINALYRPGTLRSGITQMYVDIRNGEKEPYYYNSEIYEKVTRDTYGLIIYQEQLINILIGVGFTYTEADTVRKLCSKSKGADAIKAYESKFLSCCENNTNIKGKLAKKLFGQLVEFGGYGFNLSHAVEYAMISFQTAYLKHYYYDAFMSALLTYGPDTKLQEHLSDALDKGYQIEKVNMRYSSALEWNVKDGSIYLPFNAIKGIGDKAALALHELRKKHKIKTLDDIMKHKSASVNTRTIGLLDKAGAFSNDDENIDASVYRIKVDIGVSKLQKIQHILYDSGVINVLRKDTHLIETQYVSMKNDTLTFKNGSAFVKLNVDHDMLRKIDVGDVLLARIKNNKLIEYVSDKQIERCYFGDLLKQGVCGYKKYETRKLIKKMKLCCACSLRTECTQVICGEYASNVVILGEAPGVDEDKEGRPFVGDAGKMLFNTLSEFGGKREHFTILNVNKCYPKLSRTPTTQQAKQCADLWLQKELEMIKPKVMLVLGNNAARYIVNNKDAQITKLNGKCEWDAKHKCWVCYCLHPAYLLRNHADTAKKEFLKGIQTFVECVNNLT